ncbi:MAG TPA: hypothetical protein VH250_02975 [Granulicella sp.]|nr:hypothetical protein [Granulicella sp.]
MRTSESGFRLGLGLLVERAERILFCVIAAAGLGVIAMVGCHRNAAPTAASESAGNAAANTGPDPAQANLAPVSGSGATQVLGQSQQAPTSESSQEYMQQQAAPIERQAPPDPGAGYQDQGGYTDQDADAGYQATLTDEQASEPPPPLPVYDQPEAPDPDLIWTPGYWAYGPYGYYWVPGAWCEPPYIGALWTPGYWGYYGGRYRFHHGFWGPHIGYYGGVNYGFGYVGVGYLGGYWNGPHFYYNRNFNRVGPGVRNVYARDETFNNVHYNSYAVNSRLGPRVSYNGGNGGVRYAPRPAELAAVREQRIAPMPSQVQAAREAGQNRQQFYGTNHGRPAIAASPRPFAAERGVAPPARTTADPVRPGMQPRPGQNETRPAPMVNRPGQPAPQARPGQPERAVGGRPGESRVGNPQPQAPPRSEIRRVPQGQFQPRPSQPEQARPAPQSRPQPQQFARPQEPARQAQPRPEPQVRQPRPEARPQPQMRPQPEPRQQPQARPQPQGRPQPQMQPRPQAPPQPRPQHGEEHPKA